MTSATSLPDEPATGTPVSATTAPPSTVADRLTIFTGEHSFVAPDWETSGTRDRRDAAPEELGAFLGRTIAGVVIEELIGVGGMGAVFRGRRGDRTVAIKLVAPWLARRASMSRRFVREAEAQRRLAHPHITPILDTGQEDGVSYIVMTYMPGGSLRERLESSNLPDQPAGSLDEQTARPLFIALAKALDHAHSHGFIHRDIVPGNVLLDEHGNPHLSDFGLVGVLGDTDVDVDVDDEGVGPGPAFPEGPLADGQSPFESITRTGAVMGTPPYMSPELCAGRAADHRSDLYSLGCLMYRVLCGRPPFECRNALDYREAHISQSVTPPQQLNPRISDDLNAIIVRLLQKVPDHRLQVASELVRVLEEGYLNDPYASGERTLRDERYVTRSGRRARTTSYPGDAATRRLQPAGDPSLVHITLAYVAGALTTLALMTVGDARFVLLILTGVVFGVGMAIVIRYLYANPRDSWVRRSSGVNRDDYHR